MTSLIQIQVWNKMLITFRDKSWSAGQQVSCTLSEDNYYNVRSNSLTRLKLVHGQMSVRTSGPVLQPNPLLAMFVEEVEVYHLLYYGISKTNFRGLWSVWAHVTALFDRQETNTEKIFWLRVNTDWENIYISVRDITPHHCLDSDLCTSQATKSAQMIFIIPWVAR